MVAQVAGSLILLVVAGLFVRSLAGAERLDLGFQPDHVMNFLVNMQTSIASAFPLAAASLQFTSETDH